MNSGPVRVRMFMTPLKTTMPAKRAPTIMDCRREFRPSGVIRPFPPPEHESDLNSPLARDFTFRWGSIASTLRKNQRKHCELGHRRRLTCRNETPRSTFGCRLAARAPVRQRDCPCGLLPHRAWRVGRTARRRGKEQQKQCSAHHGRRRPMDLPRHRPRRLGAPDAWRGWRSLAAGSSAARRPAG